MDKIVIYLVYIIVSVIFAFLAQKHDKNVNEHKITGKLGKTFWILSILGLVLLMGFRKCGVGVDDITYKSIFEEVGRNGFINVFLDTRIEPGYLLLNQIIAFFTKDFQTVILITTLIPMCIYFRAIEYEKNNISLPITVFLFGSLMCIYYFGIIRLFIAASIIAYSLRYIFRNEVLKYIICILFAMTFHYSAGIMFLFVILAIKNGKHEKMQHEKKRLLLVLVVVLIVVPICMVMLSEVVFPFMGSRYDRYRLKYTGISLGDFDKLPFLIMFICFYKIFKKEVENGNSLTYILFYAMLTIISIYASFMDIGRLQWYFNLSACILFSRVFKTVKQSKFKILILGYLPALFIYGTLYMNNIINSSSRVKMMSNYINILFK